MLAHMRRHSVTTSSAVPSQLQALAREVLSLHGAEAAAAGRAPCSSLKRVLSGGEALTATMAQEISAAMPRCKLFNTYGPTETTVGESGTCKQQALCVRVVNKCSH
jgi:non-ribosomal peptide synthetase component F